MKFSLRKDSSLDNEIDLKVNGGLGYNYQVSTIAYKLYEKDNIPDDKTILEDIGNCSKGYDMYINQPTHEIADNSQEQTVNELYLTLQRNLKNY